MTKENKKTILRTIRLTKGLDELLQKDADSKRITVGALVSTILTKYSQWDRYTEKFDMITFRQETLRAILEATDDEALIRKAREPRSLENFFCSGSKKLTSNHTFDIWNCFAIMEGLHGTNLNPMRIFMLLPFFTIWVKNGLYFLSMSWKKV